jgi:hypothetical protein
MGPYLGIEEMPDPRSLIGVVPAPDLLHQRSLRLAVDVEKRFGLVREPWFKPP